jgi:hypothetical protein
MAYFYSFEEIHHGQPAQYHQVVINWHPLASRSNPTTTQKQKENVGLKSLLVHKG